MSKALELDELWISRLLEQLNGLEYGSLNVIVHDGRIVQLEKTERKRFDPPRSGGKGTQD
ncbi:YezD family protein [Paenibacillus aurantius]|uniref:YezD family protein n=1 Tax=Paenibacillus aurantius TaxID=2918900 RepID=A0AA96LBV7_9BACL|nr:YezD family protein [Paenibacillus aurantius]WNQ10278.1 YezD family protein [Paenibacillus aurantius]